MSIQSEFDFVGHIDGIVEGYPKFTKEIVGVSAPGITSSDTNRITVEVDFSVNTDVVLSTYGSVFYLYKTKYNHNQPPYRYFILTAYKSTGTTMECNREGGTINLGKLDGPHIVKITPEDIFLDGNVFKTVSADPPVELDVEIKPSFFTSSGFEKYSIKDFKFYLDDKLIQWYKPAKRNNVLGLYEQVTGTFCR